MAALPLEPGGQIIVVGDPRQMPPIVKHDWSSERRRTFQEYKSYQSLFDTLLESRPAPPMIKFAESFRLHADMGRLFFASDRGGPRPDESRRNQWQLYRRLQQDHRRRGLEESRRPGRL